MRKRFLSLGTVIAVAALVGAPAAQAHHIDHAASNITCALVNGASTLSITTAYRQFADSDKPVQVAVYLNGNLVRHTWLTWGGPDFDDRYSQATAPGEYDVHYWAGWSNGFSDKVDAHVSCLVPPPTPTPTPTPPVPSPTPPPVTPPPVPPPPAPPVKHCTKAHVKIKVYPRRRLHGEVNFAASGVKRSDVASVRWYVRRPGHGWRRVGTSGRPWEYLAHRGLSWHVYLWVEQVWGYPQWGMRHVKVVVHTKGSPQTCAGVASAQLAYFNHDPEPRARHWG